MLRALKYFIVEAASSLWRGWRSAVLAVLTIAAGLFVLGFLIIVNTNLQALVGRWSEAAEISVYLADPITPEQLKSIEGLIDRSGVAASRQRVTKIEAVARFKQDFPDLAVAADKLKTNPFPASIEVRLRPDARA